MTSTEKLKIISTFMAFVSAASVCGFVFYCLVQGESYERYKNIVVGFGLIFFICAIITLFIAIKLSSLISYVTYDDYGESVSHGVKSGNHLGLLALSIFNLILFNPFYPIPSLFEVDTYDGIFNKAYSLMLGALVLSSFLYYTTKQQLKEILH